MNRRSFITGLSSLIAAPAIVPYGSLMPVRGIIQAIQDNELLCFYILPEWVWAIYHD